MSDKLNFCKGDVYLYDGFHVQHGMLFGNFHGQKYVTNGRLIGDAYPVYFRTVDETMEIVWKRRPVRLEDDPELFTLIESGVRKREAKGIDLHYLSGVELEEIRWKQDPYHRHFQNRDPFASPKVHSSGRDPHAAAKYQCMRERSMLTQRPNTVKYVYASSVTII